MLYFTCSGDFKIGAFISKLDWSSTFLLLPDTIEVHHVFLDRGSTAFMKNYNIKLKSLSIDFGLIAFVLIQ